MKDRPTKGQGEAVAMKTSKRKRCTIQCCTECKAKAHLPHFFPFDLPFDADLLLLFDFFPRSSSLE
jgi:hypothetical protein